jgi:hypothetical protein
MEPEIATLLQRLVEGPAFLLLGQVTGDSSGPVPQPVAARSSGLSADQA